MESRWSPNLITSISVIRFNFDYELNRLFIKESIQGKLVSLGLKIDVINKATDIMAHDVTGKDFDEEHLVPLKLIELCKLLNIEPKQVYDDYYEFVLSNYNDFILKFREQNNLSQKKLAKLLSVSPTYILSWEAKASFPDRKHYRRLVKLFKEYV